MRQSPTTVRLITVLIYLIATCSFAYSATPAIENGLQYLSSAQNTDGSWASGASPTTDVSTTVSVLETLQTLNQSSSPSYTSARSWLQSQGLYTTAYLSERIHALTVAGTDGDLLLSYIDEMAHAWGGYDDFRVNSLDTALALQALRAESERDVPG